MDVGTDEDFDALEGLVGFGAIAGVGVGVDELVTKACEGPAALVALG